MALELEKEITVKLKWGLDETKVNFVNKGIPLVESYILKDIYLVKEEVDIYNTNNLDILSRAIIIREVIANKTTRKIVYKDKKYDDLGNIVQSLKYSCSIESVEDAYNLLTNIGFKECFRYEQECLAFAIDDKEILLEYIPELGLFAELENNNKSIEQLINDLNELNIPYYEDEYFVKKASLMIDEIKGRRR